MIICEEKEIEWLCGLEFCAHVYLGHGTFRDLLHECRPKCKQILGSDQKD